MTSSMNYFYCLLVVVIFSALPVKSMELEKCKGVNLDVTEEHMMSVKECLTKAGASNYSDLAADKMPCFGKCVMMKKGIIDEKGMPHKENIIKMIADNMPKVVHDDLNKRMETCLAEETEMIDNADATCTTYMPLGMCIHLAFLEECEKE